MIDEDEIGRPAAWSLPPGAIVRVKIGDDLFQGAGIRVQRYRTWGRREAFQLELVDAILIEDGRL